MRTIADIGTTGQMAYEKTPSALDGVQFGRATRDHIRAAKSSMPRFGFGSLWLAARRSHHHPGTAGAIEANAARLAAAVQWQWNVAAAPPERKSDGLVLAIGSRRPSAVSIQSH
jgi:hypothetical protein